MESDSTWEFSRDELRQVPPFLAKFMRHPLNGIKAVPSWQWPTALLTWIGLLMISGAASGLFTRKFGDFIVGLLIFPITGTIMTAISSAFFYYSFQIFLQREISYRKLYLLMCLTGIPYLLFRIISPVAPPADLLGVCFSSALLIVGLVENFGLPRKFVMQLVGAVFAVFAVFWVASLIQNSQYTMRPRMDVTPDSFEKLEKELKQSED